MSDKLPQQSESEEVDLGQLFNAIGRLFERFFAFLGKILKGIFSGIIYLIKPFVINFKLVLGVLAASAILGFVVEKLEQPVFYSDMVVKPYFDSKYQLSNNIDYFNDLISSQSFEELSDIFEIDTTEAKNLKRFEFQQGPQSANDLFLEYNQYIQSIDTSLVDELTYESFLKSRDFLSGSIFTIKAWSDKRDIFPNLEKGFIKIFANDFSKSLKARRDSTVNIEIQNLSQELSRIDTIQKTYLEVIKNESQNSKLSFDIGSMIPIQEDKTVTKEFDFFIREQQIRSSLGELKQELIEGNTIYDVVSGFDNIGSKDQSVRQNYVVLMPLLALVILFLAFFGVKAFKFIKTYE